MCFCVFWQLVCFDRLYYFSELDFHLNWCTQSPQCLISTCSVLIVFILITVWNEHLLHLYKSIMTVCRCSISIFGRNLTVYLPTVITVLREDSTEWFINDISKIHLDNYINMRYETLYVRHNPRECI